MKYYPIYELNQLEKDIVIEEIAQCIFADHEDGKQLTLGEIAALMVRTVDLVLMRQLK